LKILFLLLMSACPCWSQAAGQGKGTSAPYESIQRLLESAQPGRALTAIDAALNQHPSDRLLENLRGLALQQLGRSNEAAACFRKVIQLTPGSATGYTNLGVLLSETGKTGEAAKLFEEALKRDPKEFTALLGLGVGLASSSDYAKAVLYFRRALEARPGDFQAGYQYAFALGKLDRAAEAQKVLAAIHPPEDSATAARYFALRGSVAAARKDWGAARQNYAKAYQLAPASFEIYSAMVGASLQSQDPSESLSLPNSPPNLTSQQHSELGLLFASERAYTQAISEFQEALRLDPSNDLAAYDIIMCYRGSGQTEDAIKACEALLQRKPVAQLYSLLGSLDEELDRYQDAVTNLEKATQLDPSTEQYRFELGSQYLSHADYSKALEVFEAGSRKFPTAASEPLGMGLAHYALRQYPDAGEALLRALEIDPSSRTAFSAWNTTTSFFGPAEWKRMLPLAQRLADAHPDNAEAVYCYGVSMLRCQVASGETTELKRAQSLLEQAIRLEPRFMEAHLELGNVYLAEKQNQAAVEELREALRLDPESLTARYRLAQAYRTVNQLHSAQQELAHYEEQYHFDLGREYLVSSSPDAALREFRLGIQKYPASARLQFGLGLAFAALRQYSAAADALVRAMELDPSYPVYSAWNSTAAGLSSADWEKIVSRIERLLHAHPSNAQVLYCGGVAFVRSQVAQGGAVDPKRAQLLFEQAIRLEPRLVEAHLELGNLYMAEKDNQRAVKEFREALQLAPESSTVHQLLAQAYQNLGLAIPSEQEMARYRELVVRRATKAAEAGTIVQKHVLPAPP